MLVDFDNDGFKIECEIKLDGDKFCIGGRGWCFATMPYGFGDTMLEAVADFKSNVRNNSTRT